MPVVCEVEPLSQPVPLRCPKCMALAQYALHEGLEAALVGRGACTPHVAVSDPKQVIAQGIWTEVRVWDWACTPECHLFSTTSLDVPMLTAVCICFCYVV